jgi:hypothetical protein
LCFWFADCGKEERGGCTFYFHVLKIHLPRLLVIGFVALFFSCKMWGARDNPADPEGDNYQGYDTVASSADIKPVSPEDGGTLSTSAFTITSVVDASAYELCVASSAAALDSSPVFSKADFSSNTITLLSDSIVTWNTYYWKARARTARGWDKEWSPAYRFMTDFSYVWTDRSALASATAGLNWHSIASSSSGQYLVACVDGGNIWTSADYGTTWTSRIGSGTDLWMSVASSSDGKYLAAVQYSGPIWTSTDYGATWSSNTGPGYYMPWTSVASSSDGKYLAASSDSNLWISSNYGSTWTKQTTSWDRLQGVRLSSDGRCLVLFVLYGYFWISTDYGASWIKYTGLGTTSWTDVALSADGKQIAIVDNYGSIWISSDYGATWTGKYLKGQYYSIYKISMSADGKKLAAVVDKNTNTYNYCIMSSRDSGATWQDEGIELTHYSDTASIASSADGTRLAVADNFGHIWTGCNATLAK